jgi:serine phosphatase RsbU (regulator of sigma subunit)
MAPNPPPGSTGGGAKRRGYPFTHLGRGPIRFLSVAWLLTAAVLLAFLWCAYDSYRKFENTAQRNVRIQELRGQIVHLDEVLTMSARMGAVTGDSSWESRYRRYEVELDVAIREAMTHAVGVETTKQTDAANAILIEIENRAFDLARQGRLDEAKGQLFSEEYARQKVLYAEGMAMLGRQLDEAAASAMQTQRARISIQLIAGAVVIVLLVIGWVVVMRVVHQWLKTRNQLDKIERDLDIAREIQRGLLPNDVPKTPGFEVEGWSQPADQTGGDYFDWMTLPDGRTLITLADVTGHGIGPALIVSVCRAYMRAAAVGEDVALASAISRVNDLLQMDIPEGRFVTAAVGVLHTDDKEMALVSAGQAPLFFYHAATGEVENWPADELPLGIAPGLTFEAARRVRFETGDALILTTDGFFEWANGAGEQYGIERLTTFVRAHASETPAKFIEALHADVVAHAAGQAQPDDLTVVVIKRSGTAPASPGESASGAATATR